MTDTLQWQVRGVSFEDGSRLAEDWRGVCADMRLEDGTFWPIPITLSCSAELADSVAIGDTVSLENESRAILGTLEVSEKYAIETRFECEHVYRCCCSTRIFHSQKPLRLLVGTTRRAS